MSDDHEATDAEQGGASGAAETASRPTLGEAVVSDANTRRAQNIAANVSRSPAMRAVLRPSLRLAAIGISDPAAKAFRGVDIFGPLGRRPLSWQLTDLVRRPNFAEAVLGVRPAVSIVALDNKPLTYNAVDQVLARTSGASMARRAMGLDGTVNLLGSAGGRSWSRHLEADVARSLRRVVAPYDTPLIKRYTAPNVGPRVNLDGLLPRFDFAELFTDLAVRLRAREQRRPPNWSPDWLDAADLDTYNELVNDHGIPIVFVPRWEIVEKLLAAPDRSARMTVLVERQADIVQDCRDALVDVAGPTVDECLKNTTDAVEALAAGHHSAAQALAVNTCDTLIQRIINGSYGSYKKIKDEVTMLDVGDLTTGQLRRSVALAPAGPFYQPYWGNEGEQRPDGVSRHVSAHYADDESYSSAFAVQSVMLLVSIVAMEADAALDTGRVDELDGVEPGSTADEG